MDEPLYLVIILKPNAVLRVYVWISSSCRSNQRHSFTYVNVARDRLPWFVTFQFTVINTAYGVIQGFTHGVAQGITQCCFRSSCKFAEVGRPKLLRGPVTRGPPESMQILN